MIIIMIRNLYSAKALNNIIIKFGYNAHCHWLKERAL